MYYITNQNNQIIAIDPNLLALLEVENIDDLYREIALGDIKFSPSKEESKITIAKAQNKETYDVENTDLSGMLGNITLVQIQTSPKESMLINDDSSTFALAEKDEAPSIVEDEDELVQKILGLDVTEEEELLVPDDDLVSIKDTDALLEEEDTSALDDSALNLDLPVEEELSLLDDDLISIKDTDALLEEETSVIDDSEEVAEESSATEENDDALFDLILPSAPKETIDTITITENEQVETADDKQAPIIIDAQGISQSIGISTEDYNTFLNEYIDTALSLEEDLQSIQEEKRSNAISILSHLSNVLHLPVISELVTKIENATAEDQNRYIESFYSTLGRLTTSQLVTAKEEAPSISEIDSDIKVEKIDSVDIDTIALHEEKPLSVPESKPVMPASESFATINLDDVKSIHFDFQLEQAANELNLPVELIEEFVHDFIEQAHTETKKMLEAYEKGDLDTIQKIGHLLKGTSSNLRIKPLSDTLYEIQFCKDINKLEKLIKHYWGHFLSLETQINLTSK
ncbi:MAG: hypothetical protein U9R13_03125 [Campylobacterota bacterium]|nr:hypothetical protein [Campylobacterota bacterium]